MSHKMLSNGQTSALGSLFLTLYFSWLRDLDLNSKGYLDTEVRICKEKGGFLTTQETQQQAFPGQSHSCAFRLFMRLLASYLRLAFMGIVSLRWILSECKRLCGLYSLGIRVDYLGLGKSVPKWFPLSWNKWVILLWLFTEILYWLLVKLSQLKFIP